MFKRVSVPQSPNKKLMVKKQAWFKQQSSVICKKTTNCLFFALKLLGTLLDIHHKNVQTVILSLAVSIQFELNLEYPQDLQT